MTLGGEFFPSFTVGQQQLAGLPRRDLHADFHCVTTWTKRDLDWSGWAVRDLYDSFMAPRVSMGAVGTHLEVVALDGYSTSVLLEDALAANVIVADRLQGEPISREHGAPLRLVAPRSLRLQECEAPVRDQPAQRVSPRPRGSADAGALRRDRWLFTPRLADPRHASTPPCHTDTNTARSNTAGYQ